MSLNVFYVTVYTEACGVALSPHTGYPFLSLGHVVEVFLSICELSDRAARDAAVAMVTAGCLASIAKLHPRSARG
jgi:hypothetical protein